jgi:hypothetical protein
VAQHAGCLDSGLVRAEYKAPAGSVRLHRSQTSRGRRLLPNTASRSSPTSAVLPYSHFAFTALHILLSDCLVRRGRRFRSKGVAVSGRWGCGMHWATDAPLPTQHRFARPQRTGRRNRTASLRSQGASISLAGAGTASLRSLAQSGADPQLRFAR